MVQEKKFNAKIILTLFKSVKNFIYKYYKY